MVADEPPQAANHRITLVLFSIFRPNDCIEGPGSDLSVVSPANPAKGMRE